VDCRDTCTETSFKAGRNVRVLRDESRLSEQAPPGICVVGGGGLKLPVLECYAAAGVSLLAVVRRPLNPKVEYSST
jgi:thiamine monophosphate synthase